MMANGGTPVVPHFLREVQDSKTGRRRKNSIHTQVAMAFKPEYVKLVQNAMAEVTKPGGTAARAGAGAPYSIAGKTGTAQVIGMKQGEKYDERRVKERLRDHALFISYAPADNPRLAIAVLVENGSHGSTTAAPIAREVYDYFLLGKMPAGRTKLDAENEESD